ncbi:high mobility group B protein 10-like [Glycine soja]|uniref:ARID domain-containing protein n=2 Tax=Glycine subgen. Soja TaxID=1462606 RepID=A0A445F304_GLYSO|nr:high mobility group B protein 10-like [Glycine soja]RZB43140.1 hypothetical protein D0Y65_053651 [Glycine soja]
MESKEERKRMLPSPSETQLKGLAIVSTYACADESHAEQCSPGHDSESFYMKLAELLESSGLSLIFNVRETLLDLYLLYLEVTRRGGYHQVGREKKWGEVVFAMKLEGNSVKLCAQVEKLYAHLLYQFEKLYFYRHPAKQAGSISTKGPLQKKRNSTASLSHTMNIKDGQMVTEMSKDYSCHMTDSNLAGAGYVEQPVFLPPPSNVKEMKKRRGSPPGRKTAYQIFLKHECARLKTCSQALDGRKILRLAIDTWRNMSDIEKQPYVEESKKNKEAMNGHNKQQSTQDTIKEEKWHSLSGDYLVTSQPETDNSLVNKAAAGLVLKMTEKAPTDPSYLMEWDAYCSLVLPTRESE